MMKFLIIFAVGIIFLALYGAAEEQSAIAEVVDTGSQLDRDVRRIYLNSESTEYYDIRSQHRSRPRPRSSSRQRSSHRHSSSPHQRQRSGSRQQFGDTRGQSDGRPAFQGRAMQIPSVPGRAMQIPSVPGRAMQGRSMQGRSMQGRSMQVRSMTIPERPSISVENKNGSMAVPERPSIAVVHKNGTKSLVTGNTTVAAAAVNGSEHVGSGISSIQGKSTVQNNLDPYSNTFNSPGFPSVYDASGASSFPESSSVQGGNNFGSFDSIPGFNSNPGGNNYNPITGGNNYNSVPGGNYYNSIPGGNNYNSIPGGNSYSSIPGGNNYNSIPGGNNFNSIPGYIPGSNSTSDSSPYLDFHSPSDMSVPGGNNFPDSNSIPGGNSVAVLNSIPGASDFLGGMNSISGASSSPNSQLPPDNSGQGASPFSGSNFASGASTFPSTSGASNFSTIPGLNSSIPAAGSNLSTPNSFSVSKFKVGPKITVPEAQRITPTLVCVDCTAGPTGVLVSHGDVLTSDKLSEVEADKLNKHFEAYMPTDIQHENVVSSIDDDNSKLLQKYNINF